MGYPPSQKTTGLPVDERAKGLVLRRDAAQTKWRITAPQPEAKAGRPMGPRVYRWGSILQIYRLGPSSAPVPFRLFREQ